MLVVIYFAGMHLGLKIPMVAYGLWALIAGVSTIGDFFESSIKRAVDVKDSSRLLPGHGGFWDRLDAHLFALPLMALVILVSQ